MKRTIVDVILMARPGKRNLNHLACFRKNVILTAMRQIWSLALACLTKLKILTKHEKPS